MIRYIEWKKGGNVVELGGGRGIATRALIEKKPDETLLTSCEIQKDRYDDLKKYENHHTKVLHMDAQSCLLTFEPGSVDTVVSTLPLGSMNPIHVREILAAIEQALSKDGYFIQYQYFATNKEDIEQYFHISKTDWEPLNFPPAFIYICKKK